MIHVRAESVDGSTRATIGSGTVGKLELICLIPDTGTIHTKVIHGTSQVLST